jgi:hypothetical protein
LENDRDEVTNLAKLPQHQEILKRLRGAQQDWVQSIPDVGFLPDPRPAADSLRGGARRPPLSAREDRGHSGAGVRT